MAKRRSEAKPEVTIVGQEEAQPVSAPATQLVRPAPTFAAWWLKVQQAKRLKPELREAVRKHFQARGFMANNDFDKGLIDFGIRP